MNIAMFVRRVDKRVFQGDVRFFNEKKIKSTLLEKICKHFKLLAVTLGKLEYFSLMYLLPQESVRDFKECRKSELAERWSKWFVLKHDPWDKTAITISGFSEKELVERFLECEAIQWRSTSYNRQRLEETVVVDTKMLCEKSFEEAELLLDLNGLDAPVKGIVI